MKCLMKYQWVKLPREHLPPGKGIMGRWAKLAAHAAFRKGKASYCGYSNDVSPGMWAGGVVGLKSILGLRKRTETMQTLQELSDLGYLNFLLELKTKKLTYQITDWVVKCSGKECMNGSVYAVDNYGFLCLPRNITERLVERKRVFEDADAWLDLWCHTVSEDPNNAFSFLAPVIQYGKYGAVLTLETLGQRWGWEKTKVWRFFQKHGDVFALHRLPGSFGCLIFNKLYPTGTEGLIPNDEQIMHILHKIRILGENTQKSGSDHEHLNRIIAWYSRRFLESEAAKESENRVAFLTPIIRAYLSHCRNCKNCDYDCQSKSIFPIPEISADTIRGPCRTWDLTKIAKELFTYEQAG